MLSTFTILLFLCQVSTLYSKILCNDSDHLRRIRTPGDIIIGGILPIHGRVELINRTQPGPAHCSEFDISTFIQAQAMVYSINQINNSTLLPGIKLGYEIYDSCSDVINAVEATMQLISKLNSSINSVEVHCNYSAYLPRIKAVVGGVYSEISIVIARLLNLYLIPQISYSSSAEILSNKEKFASFFRTIPSDKHQTFAMIQLILYLNWNWVAVISTEDDYGQSAMNSFILHAEKHSICVDFHTLLPVHNSELFKAKINETAQKIQNSTAQVMVTFIRSTDITALFKLLIEKKVNKTWIASDAWSSSRTISTLKQIEKIGTILGFSFKDGKISNFKQYLEKLVMHSKNVDKFTEEFLSITNNRNGTQTGKKLQFKKSHEYEKINANINEAFTYGVYLTIHAITHALRRMLNCDYKKCNRNFDFPPWQII
ncbi:G-protein coupled receptor family C group 6 member A-like [Narcine bancroftii]|uniref:G-protein coupled receptor family C group 6 member A-like n=1 Tax=Narcine bancroftii TaxID=1343680 RepID=UPI003831B9EA